jgi:hypothetical protein
MSKNPFFHLVIYIIWEQILSQFYLNKMDIDIREYMCIVYSYIQLWIQSWSPFLVFSRSNVDVTHARDHAERME